MSLDGWLKLFETAVEPVQQVLDTVQVIHSLMFEEFLSIIATLLFCLNIFVK